MREKFRLDGQVAVVTGACGKLGPIWIAALLSAGARVAALDLPGISGSSTFDELCAAGAGDVARFDCDITERASIEVTAGEVARALGEPSVLVNNAGVDQPPDASEQSHHLHELPIDVFRKMVEVNLLGTFQATQVFGHYMADGNGGSVINIGSLYASVSPDPHFYDHLARKGIDAAPFIKSPAYGASKAGVINLTRFFATHWAAQGVRVNALSPGGVLAAQDSAFKAKYVARVPLGRMAEPGDLEGPLVFLASSASSYITGHELRVDGGFTAL